MTSKQSGIFYQFILAFEIDDVIGSQSSSVLTKKILRASQNVIQTHMKGPLYDEPRTKIVVDAPFCLMSKLTSDYGLAV